VEKKTLQKHFAAIGGETLWKGTIHILPDFVEQHLILLSFDWIPEHLQNASVATVPRVD
jgi:hypothetical protein